MKIRLRAFGIAKDILKSGAVELDEDEIRTTGDVKSYLSKAYPEFDDLLTFSLAVRDEYQEDDYVLADNDEVIVIPPVSGG